MNAELRRPDRRECELCGRNEVWDEDAGAWRVRKADDGEHDGYVGRQYCIHEWDIDGDGGFAPFPREPSASGREDGGDPGSA